MHRRSLQRLHFCLERSDSLSQRVGTIKHSVNRIVFRHLADIAQARVLFAAVISVLYRWLMNHVDGIQASPSALVTDPRVVTSTYVLVFVFLRVRLEV